MDGEVQDCWMCGETADNWELTVARVCRSCYTNSAERLASLGYVITPSEEGRDHVITVKAPHGKEPMVGLIFGPETLRTIITRTFLAEVQVGEKRFDDKVYLEFADKADIPLLRGIEVEDLIIELVQDGIVHLIGDHADVHVHGRRVHDDNQLGLLCAALINAVHQRKREIGQI